MKHSSKGDFLRLFLLFYSVELIYLFMDYIQRNEINIQNVMVRTMIWIWAVVISISIYSKLSLKKQKFVKALLITEFFTVLILLIMTVNMPLYGIYKIIVVVWYLIYLGTIIFIIPGLKMIQFKQIK